MWMSILSMWKKFFLALQQYRIANNVQEETSYTDKYIRQRINLSYCSAQPKFAEKLLMSKTEVSPITHWPLTSVVYWLLTYMRWTQGIATVGKRDATWLATKNGQNCPLNTSVQLLLVTALALHRGPIEIHQACGSWAISHFNGRVGRGFSDLSRGTNNSVLPKGSFYSTIQSGREPLCMWSETHTLTLKLHNDNSQRPTEHSQLKSKRMNSC